MVTISLTLAPIIAAFVRSMFLTVHEGIVDYCSVGKCSFYLYLLGCDLMTHTADTFIKQIPTTSPCLTL